MARVIVLILSLISLLLIYYFFFYHPQLQLKKLLIKGQEFTFEIAKTPAQKSRGLMHRQSLCPNCGMLFDFHLDGYYPFWMKNTLIPLDIIWVNNSGEVVDIKQGQIQDTTLLTNTKRARYVLETNPGSTTLKIGDTLNL